MGETGVEEFIRNAEKRDRRWARVGWTAVIFALLVAGGIFAYIALNRVETSDERALETIRNAGLRDPKLGGAVTAGCEQNESSRHFTATSAAGEAVAGTVCCSLTGLQGCLIRSGR